MAPIALGEDKITFDLLVRREGVDVARVMCHKVCTALSTPHINPNNCLQPQDGVTQFTLANRVVISAELL